MKPGVEVKSIDFPYYVARVARFYSWSYDQIMSLPLRVFWAMNAQITRLRAEEGLELIDLQLLSHMGTSGEMVSQLRSNLRERMGTPMVAIEVFSREDHMRAIDKLKQIAAQMK